MLLLSSKTSLSKRVHEMCPSLSFAIFVTSTLVWVAAVSDATAAALSESAPYEKYISSPWKHLQKVNHDDYRLGVRKSTDSGYETNIPKELDARRHFSNCAQVIGRVKDQGNCASSWAVAVASTFTDRLCIATNGSFTENLSAQNLMACGDNARSACFGGSALRAWEFTMSRGIVTGGDFGSREGCQPYRRSPCSHYGTNDVPRCSSLGALQPTICQNQCLNKNHKVDYSKDLHKTSTVYLTSWTNVTQIQQEIITYGPVTALMFVYENFMKYREGVYKTTGGSLVGYHHVKLIGWGVDSDTGDEYWLAMNSWNTGWGDEGLFKILKGYNFCSIEMLVMAGIADVE